MLVELEAVLAKRHQANEKSVLVVSEAHDLPLEVFEEIRQVANIETTTEKHLTVLIAGTPELSLRLNEAPLRRFKQHIALRCNLVPFTAQETAAYLVGRIRAAGGDAKQMFTRQSVALIHDLGNGSIRRITLLAHEVLSAGHRAGQKPVTSQVVSMVFRDFDSRLVATVRHADIEAEPAARVEPSASDSSMDL